MTDVSAADASGTADDEDVYSHTPHLYISAALRDQRARSREAAASLLVEAFQLEQFDASTIALAAADIGQIREAIRRVRTRRYGAIEIRFIELDIVSWHILPSPENVRFEELRVRATDAAPRYGSLEDGSPVLVLDVADETKFISRLDSEVEDIWITNDHSKSIPFRGIENPGLLSLARITSAEHGVVGVLDATDGFGRTVGAQKALRIGPKDVLWKFSEPEKDHELRQELISLRANPHDADDPNGEHLSDENKERLRGSIMLRAQVIVGYSNLQKAGDGGSSLSFDAVRRKLVGHIHIEPAKPFSLGTQYALKATAAIEALDAAGCLPTAPNFLPSEVASLFWIDSPYTAQTRTILSDGRIAVRPDEVFLLGLTAMRASTGRNDRRARITNAAIRDLTGQTPTRADRLVLASDLALRLGELASGTQANDPTFESRRSSLDRSIRPKVFESLQLTREPIEDLLSMALLELGEARESSTEVTIRPYSAELAGLALFHLLGKPGRRLLERATKKESASASYISEPNVVVESLMSTEKGLNQLAQIVLDGRAGRQPQNLGDATSPVDSIIQEGVLLDPVGLRQIAGDSTPASPLPESAQSRLNSQIGLFKQEVRNLVDRVESITRIPSGEEGTSPGLVSLRGAALRAEGTELQNVVYKVQGWAQTIDDHVSRAQATSAEADRAALDKPL